MATINPPRAQGFEFDDQSPTRGFKSKIETQHVENAAVEIDVVKRLPNFKELPLQETHPKHSAWGLWGEKDEAGTLNLLDPETVSRAAKEIKEGLRFSLNWSLNNPRTTGFGRSNYPFCHTLHSDTPGLLCFDDSLTFNTQKSSQWDGLRHFAYQKERLFYGGVTESEIKRENSGTLGIQNVNGQGDIAGRGVLIDYCAYSESIGKTYNATTGYAITFDELISCINYQEHRAGKSMEFLQGDILIIRCGYTKAYQKLGKEEEIAAGMKLPPHSCGVEQDVRLLEWLWEHHFAAVAGDSPAFECFPPKQEAGFLLHEVLLAGWGCPIAEMLWLEDLAATCADKKRYSFFVASSPLNVFGGVASPANMMAIL